MNGFNLLPTAKYGRNFCWLTNGETVVYATRPPGLSDLWSVNVDGSDRRPLTANTDPNQSVFEPVCGPDGRIAFASDNRTGPSTIWSLWLRDIDTTKLLFESKALVRPIGWLADGDLLALVAGEEGAVIQGYRFE